jgi:hypothetical protein
MENENVKEKMFESQDQDGNNITVKLIQPGPAEYRDSQIEYNKAFRKALDSNALLRQKLEDYMQEQGIWNEDKQKKHDEFVLQISAKEDQLNSGGIKLSEAKDIALELRVLRYQFREFLSERNALDQNSVEGQADNARFAELVRLCMLNVNTNKPYFQDQQDYDKSSNLDWVIEASSELASMIYGLDPNYDNKLTENKFLKEFEFVDDDLRLINENGHLVDTDGRLIDDEGRFVKYKTAKAEKEQDEEARYFCNRDGDEVVKIEDGDETRWVTKDKVKRKPFLRDDGTPYPETAKKEDAEKEEDLVAEKTTKTKRTRKKAEPEKDAAKE